ncbi:DUF1642 domain-containing protein [Lacticaseibacillus suilingensis]|uniref:DUF1642 domain-containing protein n=1 Tax=Lacticaseibacillus suilingensis TaxID=2799577 RepID=A0ABW4BIE2_9LACO|nr:DUF1642 domain-containing protein [Lacticaseibacillus suilingensis]
MSLYAVKNDKGDYLNGVAGEKPLFGGLDKDCVLNGEDAGWLAGRGYGHVVELIEAPAKVVVSEAEAEMLEQAKCDDDPAELIVGFVNSHDKYDDDRKAEDRLMRAYVNGWTVEKPKRYGVWVPHVTGKMYFKDGRGNDGLDIASADCLNESNQQFTLAEIEHYGLQDCERVEVTDDEQ